MTEAEVLAILGPSDEMMGVEGDDVSYSQQGWRDVDRDETMRRTRNLVAWVGLDEFFDFNDEIPVSVHFEWHKVVRIRRGEEVVEDDSASAAASADTSELSVQESD
jgi:hypothetical protein